MKSALLTIALMLFAVGEAAANTGGWVCIANSTYGTHGTSSHWGDAGSRQGAEAAALNKCVAYSVNKRGCAVNRCWVGHDKSAN